ncbi:MAG TPA: heme-binding domain-containing protein [Thermoanaerobaculia bacterium]|nr:heme-binding domain-containing protein [Thermoanaerobaculia bacterium]
MKWWQWLLFLLSAMFVGIQFVRPPLLNPSIDPAKTLEATTNVPPDVRTILDRSCADCHSNKTVWPWYSKVAPVSWLLAKDVREGRRELNFSEFGTYKARRQLRKYKEICDQVKAGEMPMKIYLPLHPSAKLSDAERARLCEWTSTLTAGAPRSLPPS